MTIQVHCQHCGHDFETEVDGKTTFCPACEKETPINSTPPKPKIIVEAPPPPAEEKAEPKAMKPERQPPSFSVLQLVVLIAIAVLLFLIWQRQETVVQPVHWDYNDFQYDGKDSFQDSDGQTEYLHLFHVGYGLTNNSPTQAFGYVVDLSGLLSTIGEDGWQLEWADGTHYIVKRPWGDWKYESFYLGYSTNQD
jgi:hypothetical protein